MYRIPILAFLLSILSYSATAQYKTRRVNNGGDDVPRFRLGIDGTWSYRIARLSNDIPPGLEPFFKELKSGTGFGADGMYYFRNNLGVGLQYSLFHSANEMTGITAYDSVTRRTTTGMLKDQISIHYFGPTFGSRYILGREGNMHLGFAIGLGYMSYREKFTVVDRTALLTGGTLGSTLAITFDFALSQNILIGLKLGTASGTLSTIEVDNGTTTQRLTLPENGKESLSRIDLGGGLRFVF